ncbi:DUF6230 family protein [Streptomyces iconiensis]|uniref:DUF6230 family protein n=1 Tax=Streptomyces iconiensis TaxID=1384038 RepID=A0ABT6ZYX4_9ACTN|nr:DUF6230 family protein [Streptomyces iconiensis]MDJ1134260.1 DUF6230 family protein [Streptomyces iconiensis]
MRRTAASRARPRHRRKTRRPVGSRTDWRRFALVFPLTALLAAGTIATTTAAEIPVSFAVAGSPFTVTAQRLKATDATQFASFRRDAKGSDHPVAVVGLRSARISNLCQSAVAHTPLGTATLVIRSGEDEPVRASGMVLDLVDLTGDMTFRSVEMGRDAATLDASGPQGTAGTYGQQARSLTITDMRLKAWSLTAGMFSLAGASMSVKGGEKPCA